MSSLVLPKFPGITWPVSKGGQAVKTITQETAGGKTTTLNVWSGTLPRWNFTLSFEFLSAVQRYANIGQAPDRATFVSLNPLIFDDRAALQGFIMQVGAWDSWLFDDPNDDAIARGQIGVSDGSSPAYQMARQIGSYTENIQNINGTPILAADWQPSTAFALNALAVPTPNAIRSQRGAVWTWQTPGWPNYFQCTTAGTTGATEPNWRLAPVATMTLTDGSAVWTNMGTPFVLYSSGAALPDYATSHSYSFGTTIKPTASNAGGHSYICTVLGTSGGATTWGQTVGGTTTTGGATFQDLGVLSVGPLYPIVPWHPALYSVSATGLVTFLLFIPVNLSQISVTTAFYFRCKFQKDVEDFDQFWANFWALKSLSFQSVKI